jgi:peptidoglycan/xylan/chitin deacetylase (PgdA/CDA1 family)
MEFYTQTIAVQFRSEAAARRGRLRLAPLYHDFQAALSTRMDDNNVNAAEVLGVMARHGQRGTFFLNDPTVWWGQGASPAPASDVDPGTTIPAQILATGSSIGGHTLNHPHLPAVAKNPAFHEILGGRIALEVRTGAPVSTFAYPFVYFQSSLRRGADRSDLEEMLRRAGFLHLAEHRYHESGGPGFQDAQFLVCDGQSWQGETEEAVVARGLGRGRRPLFLVTMHAWQREWGGKGFPLLNGCYERWGDRPDWWYCNQNEYAAYRWQAVRSRLETKVVGDLLTATLIRPEPVDLGDSIALTAVIRGVEAEAVVSVAASGVEVEPLVVGGRRAFDIPHPPGRSRIEVFGTAANDRNRRLPLGAPTAGLDALLRRQGRNLTLVLKNHSTVPLRELRVVFRLPLRWKPGVACHHVPDVRPGSSVVLRQRLAESRRPAEYAFGTEYLVAQIDYVGAVRARVYASCRVRGQGAASAFAGRGFLVMGPLTPGAGPLDPLLYSRPKGHTGPAVEFPGCPRPEWFQVDRTVSASLDPDIIPTTGRGRALDFPLSHPTPGTTTPQFRFLLKGRVWSPSRRQVHAVFAKEGVRRLVVNGVRVRGSKFSLQRGANEIRILYSPPRASDALFSERHYGCYFRLNDSKGTRVRGLRFVAR